MVVKKKPKLSAKDQRMVAFRKWLESIPTDRLHDFLIDALWKDQLSDTELYRFFVLEIEYKIEMITRGYRSGE